MTDEELRGLKNFEAQIRVLLLKYKSVKEENDELRRALEEQENATRRVEAELSQSKEDYRRLKTARMIEVSDTDVREAKNRITRLVREVNKCIGLLSSDNE